MRHTVEACIVTNKSMTALSGRVEVVRGVLFEIIVERKDNLRADAGSFTVSFLKSDMMLRSRAEIQKGIIHVSNLVGSSLFFADICLA